MSHTKEPWIVFERSIKEDFQCIGLSPESGRTIGAVMGGETSGPHFVNSTAECESNARRIVACVNACTGADTNWLESMAKAGGIGAMNQYIAAYNQAATAIVLERQRDQLLTSLINCRRTLEVVNEVPGGPINDTIWYGPAETLFDYMDSVIESASKIDFV